MKILSIETSCDETALAVLSVTGKNAKCTVLAHQVASQIELHKQYGGVFPMMAKREHAKNIVPLFLETLAEAKMLTRHSYKKNTKKVVQNEHDVFPAALVKKLEIALVREQEMLEIFLREIPRLKKPKIDTIVVTVGPGLTPALWVGINFAKALALVWNIPLAPVNHMEGHVLSVLVPKTKKSSDSFALTSKQFVLPALSLLVSGGHTEIVLMKDIGKYKILGATLDDAAGEAFDKVARMLDLPYPGGPEISRLAERARRENLPKEIKLPRPMLGSKDLHFSFSGLKTAVLYLLRDLTAANVTIDDKKKMEIAREFEDAVCDVLVAKTLTAAKAHKAKSIIVGGGVSANKELARRLTESAEALGLSVSFPTSTLTTDNAIMIAIAGYFAKTAPLGSKKFIAQGNLAF